MLANQNYLSANTGSGNIEIGGIETSATWRGGDVFIDSNRDIIASGDIITSSSSALQPVQGRGEEKNNLVNAGDITLLAEGDIDIVSLVSYGELDRFSEPLSDSNSSKRVAIRGGNILISNNGELSANFMWTSASNQIGGYIDSTTAQIYSDIQLEASDIKISAGSVKFKEFRSSGSVEGGYRHLGIPGLQANLVTSSQFVYLEQKNQVTNSLIVNGGDIQISSKAGITFPQNLNPQDFEGVRWKNIKTSASVIDSSDGINFIAPSEAIAGDVTLQQERNLLEIKDINFDLRAIDNDELYGRLINGDGRTIGSGSGGAFLAHADEISLNRVSIATNALVQRS